MWLPSRCSRRVVAHGVLGCRYGIEIIVDLTYALTKPFIAPEFMEEIYGIANATDIKLEKLLGVTLLPEIIKASCSMFGAWGPATQNSRDGALVQLRALDWSTNGPFQVSSIVVVVVVVVVGLAFSSSSRVGAAGGDGEACGLFFVSWPLTELALWLAAEIPGGAGVPPQRGQRPRVRCADVDGLRGCHHRLLVRGAGRVREGVVALQGQGLPCRHPLHLPAARHPAVRHHQYVTCCAPVAAASHQPVALQCGEVAAHVGARTLRNTRCRALQSSRL